VSWSAPHPTIPFITLTFFSDSGFTCNHEQFIQSSLLSRLGSVSKNDIGKLLGPWRIEFHRASILGYELKKVKHKEMGEEPPRSSPDEHPLT
jgi:hypothetical protein